MIKNITLKKKKKLHIPMNTFAHKAKYIQQRINELSFR